MGRNHCDVNGCPSHISTVPLHTFPRTRERALIWQLFCQNPKLSEVPLEKLCMKATICRKHFPRGQFKTSACLRLNSNSVPSLFPPSSFSLSSTSESTVLGTDGRKGMHIPPATVIPTISSPTSHLGQLMQAGSSEPSFSSQPIRATPKIEELNVLSNCINITDTSRSAPSMSASFPSMNTFEGLRPALPLEELPNDSEVLNFFQTVRTLAHDKHTSFRDAQEIDSLLFIAASWTQLPGSVRQLIYTRLRTLGVAVRHGWIKVEPPDSSGTEFP